MCGTEFVIFSSRSHCFVGAVCYERFVATKAKESSGVDDVNGPFSINNQSKPYKDQSAITRSVLPRPQTTTTTFKKKNQFVFCLFVFFFCFFLGPRENDSGRAFPSNAVRRPKFSSCLSGWRFDPPKGGSIGHFFFLSFFLFFCFSRPDEVSRPAANAADADTRSGRVRQQRNGKTVHRRQQIEPPVDDDFSFTSSRLLFHGTKTSAPATNVQFFFNFPR